MASSNAKTVDIKLSFPQTDMIPGPLGLEFQRDLLTHACKAVVHVTAEKGAFT